MRAAQKLLGVLIIGGGSAREGVVLEGVKGVKYAPKTPGMYKNSEKNKRFPALIDLKIYK